jgi:hypothetical protein
LKIPDGLARPLVAAKISGQTWLILEWMRKLYDDHPATSPTILALRHAPVLASVC